MQLYIFRESSYVDTVILIVMKICIISIPQAREVDGWAG